MIEETVRNYLEGELLQPVWMEIPKNEDVPAEYVLIQKTGSGRRNYVTTSTITIQSYAASMVEAAELNSAVKSAMDEIIALDEIFSAKLDTDYNFTDTTTKSYRYQAVYNIAHRFE